MRRRSRFVKLERPPKSAGESALNAFQSSSIAQRTPWSLNGAGRDAAGAGWQPRVASQTSCPLQALPSSQKSGVPETQSPLTQRSMPLQTSESWQSASVVQHPLIEVLMQPCSGSHDSATQVAGFGGHVIGVPATHPVEGLQVSTPLHTLLSLQTSGTPGAHVPATHVSTPLQALLSSQSALLVQQPGVATSVQPRIGSHVFG